MKCKTQFLKKYSQLMSQKRNLFQINKSIRMNLKYSNKLLKENFYKNNKN